ASSSPATSSGCWSVPPTSATPPPTCCDWCASGSPRRSPSASSSEPSCAPPFGLRSDCLSAPGRRSRPPPLWGAPAEPLPPTPPAGATCVALPLLFRFLHDHAPPALPSLAPFSFPWGFLPSQILVRGVSRACSLAWVLASSVLGS